MSDERPAADCREASRLLSLASERSLTEPESAALR